MHVIFTHWYTDRYIDQTNTFLHHCTICTTLIASKSITVCVKIEIQCPPNWMVNIRGPLGLDFSPIRTLLPDDIPIVCWFPHFDWCISRFLIVNPWILLVKILFLLSRSPIFDGKVPSSGHADTVWATPGHYVAHTGHLHCHGSVGRWPGGTSQFGEFLQDMYGYLRLTILKEPLVIMRYFDYGHIDTLSILNDHGNYCPTQHLWFWALDTKRPRGVLTLIHRRTKCRSEKGNNYLLWTWDVFSSSFGILDLL
jgi:hypothetical protein